MAKTLIELKNIKKIFQVGGGFLGSGSKDLTAVNNISLKIEEGETYGLVGESGCGKTTTAKMILMLEEPTEGSIIFNDQDVFKASESDPEYKKNYKSSVQAVFQDPWASLNPRMRVRDIIGEPLEINTDMTKKQIRNRVDELLVEVGLQAYQSNLYPHEFSGGQRQRLGVARALSLNPRLIVLDEPVSALDVSIRAQIMNLLVDLQKEYNLSYLLIAHHLATVRYMCDKMGVMYLGNLMEEANATELFDNPLHNYTKALMSAALPSHPDIERDEIILEGDVPSPINPPPGCVFQPRCLNQSKCTCSETPPSLTEKKPNHMVADCKCCTA
ncbi:MAG: peptide ABC transporter substrate-binding protein [Chloroflexi bacterium]|nr:peptide ABC transporter substrate-binding protein [Chloroflexota bacterium]